MTINSRGINSNGACPISLVRVKEHIEIYDFYNNFICSGDNESDAMEGYYTLMENGNNIA